MTGWLDSFVHGFEIVGEFVIPPINADNFIFSLSSQISRLSLALFRLERRMSVFIGAMRTHYSVGICIAGTNGVRRRGRVGEERGGGGKGGVRVAPRRSTMCFRIISCCNRIYDEDPTVCDKGLHKFSAVARRRLIRSI